MNTSENDKLFKINPESGEVEYNYETQPKNSNQQMPSNFEENGSFCRLGSEDGGFLEVDLRVTKQRGTEQRCISVSVVGFNDENQISKSEMFLLDETAFKKLQAFVARLNWND